MSHIFNIISLSPPPLDNKKIIFYIILKIQNFTQDSINLNFFMRLPRYIFIDFPLDLIRHSFDARHHLLLKMLIIKFRSWFKNNMTYVCYLPNQIMLKIWWNANWLNEIGNKHRLKNNNIWCLYSFLFEVSSFYFRYNYSNLFYFILVQKGPKENWFNHGAKSLIKVRFNNLNLSYCHDAIITFLIKKITYKDFFTNKTTIILPLGIFLALHKYIIFEIQ